MRPRRVEPEERGAAVCERPYRLSSLYTLAMQQRKVTGSVSLMFLMLCGSMGLIL